MSEVMTFEITATCQIDAADAGLLEGAKAYWNEGYVRIYYKESGSMEYLHRLVVGAKKGDIVDHINRDRLDCRRENLRIVSRLGNVLNAPKQRKRLDAEEGGQPRSPYKGAFWSKQHQRWLSSFRGKYLGIFDTDIEAAAAYDQAVREGGIESAYLNFPDGKVEGPVLKIPRTKAGVSGSTSKFAGVSWNSQHNKWQGSIKRGEMKLHLGFYKSEEECAGVYDAVARAIDGDMAKVNFPNTFYDLPEKLIRRLRSKGVPL